MKALLRDASLHTVCEEAHCPNIGECFAARTATFLILGSRCTRNCAFCAIEPGKPDPFDVNEPARVAETVRQLNLRYVVVTSVTRDDLADGGAVAFAQTIEAIRTMNHECRIEVLTPDFQGSATALRRVLDAHPAVFGHNVETVPSLYAQVRRQASYKRSLELLRSAREMPSRSLIKSGIMVGLGESREEVDQVLEDLAGVCDIVTIGQYLRPSRAHLPVVKFYTPQEFEGLEAFAQRLGFRHIESGPLVRSSYHAHRVC